jgi:hypothetical protein
MKLVLSIVFVFCSCGAIRAQGPAITVQGAVLRLGMTRAEVAEELARQVALFLDKEGRISNVPDSSIGDAELEGRYRGYATTTFSNGRLSSVEKFWRPDNTPDTALTIMNALYGAAMAVAGNEGRTCTVRTFSAAQPGQDYKETVIECDIPGARRSVHAFMKTFYYKEDFTSVQVNETLEKR